MAQEPPSPGRTVALEPVWEGGGEGSMDGQLASPSCHPQQEGGGDKRTELSGSCYKEASDVAS